MKKLLYLLLAISLLTAISLQAQPQKSKTGQAYSHRAHFSVYDFTTKIPIEDAVVTNQTGQELGTTNADGELALNLPPNSSAFYTIRAEGYNPMNIRLNKAEKKSAEYEVFLPAQEIGYSRLEASIDQGISEEDLELVKVYVKQDPAEYQKTTTQAGEISFSVQIAASSNPITPNTVGHEWSEIGNVFVKQENGMYKVRIGPYLSQQEAKQVLLQVKSKGRKDAFIVVQQGTVNDEPSIKTEIPVTSTPEPVTNSQPELLEGDYKVRVASYLHPGAFNPDGIDKLGRLESYRKGEWTIMMIGGFRSKEEAAKARDIVLSKGFTDASIVRDNNGVIETIEEK